MSNNERMLLIAALLWGFSAPLNKIILQSTSELTFIWVRFLAAAIILTIVFWKKLKSADLKTIKYGLLLGGITATGALLELSATRIMNPAKLYFIISIEAVVIPYLAYVIYRQKTSKKEIISAIIASIGLIVINMNGSNIVLGWGEMLAIMCTFVYSFNVVFMSKNNKKYDNILITIFLMYGAGITGLILNLITYGTNMAVKPEGIGYIIISIIFMTLIPFVLETKAFRDISPTRAGIIYSLIPIFALVAVMIFLQDFLTIQGYIGSAIIFSALIYSNTRKIKA
ncbi:MAG TPA: hypothetical protein DEP72_04895 [Clostridiales bacterium]|nr:MAG: hypothetical protein A2Y18_02000 [Clostridiales bacterium GWD2_32_19]HCC07477.1 hypothetical protein [Clostridiales bacterium]